MKSKRNIQNKIEEKNKHYREEHKEEIQQKKKKYYEKNRAAIQEKHMEYNNFKIECPHCKCLVGKYSIKRHEQSIRHQQKVEAHKAIQNSNSHQQTIDYLNSNFPTYPEE